jgi:hypothetical protein
MSGLNPEPAAASLLHFLAAMELKACPGRACLFAKRRWLFNASAAAAPAVAFSANMAWPRVGATSGYL